MFTSDDQLLHLYQTHSFLNTNELHVYLSWFTKMQTWLPKMDAFFFITINNLIKLTKPLIPARILSKDNYKFLCALYGYIVYIWLYADESQLTPARFAQKLELDVKPFQKLVVLFSIRYHHEILQAICDPECFIYFLKYRDVLT